MDHIAWVVGARMSKNDDQILHVAAAAAGQTSQPSPAIVARVDRYLGDAAAFGAQAVLQSARTDLQRAPATEWSDVARQFLQRGQPVFAAALLELARRQYPADSSLHYWFAQSLWQAGETERAEAELRGLLADASHLAAGQLLAQVLRAQGRLHAAADCMAAVARQMTDDPDGFLGCIQFVRESHQHALAAELCAEQLASGASDPRLHAAAGQIAQELGYFDSARGHYAAALDRGIDVNAWFVPGSLASLQRYADRQHADFNLFDALLRKHDLSPRARASILFAVGKGCDDIGAYAEAAHAWRHANALTRSTVNWSRTQWQGFIRDRLSARPLPSHPFRTDTVPIFVVGLPRTGTTLIAELLGSQPAVCNRGELRTLEFLAQRLAGLEPSQRAASLPEAAGIYLTHLRRDDAPASHYVDKNPLNLRFLDQVAAMFPQARVIYCRRQPRDTALSIWSQPFARDDYAFARDFADIAAVMDGCEALMRHWRQTLPLRIITVEYEHLVADPVATINALLPQLGLSLHESSGLAATASTPITSASLWQARQPVHRRSVSRWRPYAELLPELVELFDEA
jgi:tetratricopeptide (TPR) repeat protein